MHTTFDKPFPVVAATDLAKLDDSNLPDPFAVISVDTPEQIHTTRVTKRTLSPCWNERFDVSVALFSHPFRPSL